MIKINIIAWHNGGGLSRDVDILLGALPQDRFAVTLNGQVVEHAPQYRRRIGHRAANQYQLLFDRKRLARAGFDINLFLEDIVPGFFPFARANAFMPNPEWFKRSQHRHLTELDIVLCKTRIAQRTFEALGCKTGFTSFTSEDRLDISGTVQREKGFLHIAGRSWQKGTKALTDLWLRHPQWPVLRVVQGAKTYRQSTVKPISAPNIDHILDRVDDASLRILQNAHRVHLCPSEAEGFGHCIAEAMSCRALTLTTNAPPMNELITADRGVLVDFNRTQQQRSGQNYYVDPAKLEKSIEAILHMDEAAIADRGVNARAWFEENDRRFRQLLIDAIETAVAAS